MIIRRYWRIAVFAPFVGFLIAAAVAVVMTNAGSGETDYRFWFLALSMANYGVIGAIIALCAMLGGLAAVAILDRHLARSRRLRTFIAALGAVVGVLLLSVGVSIALTLLDDAAYAGITMAFGLVFGLASSIAAAVMVLWADWRSR
ncbi:hypothetical protein E3O25_06370 [Cryobacterium sp. TMT1-3]|uniref:Uncharacterized protein n=1 Tax=Cryobacterium luteum TaxID=1424661 RepID=A0A1H8FJY1_9MICO|nr:MULTISPECIES: hypothetical protein [Cryobacterium]TFB93384.1 hypothetical protein E3O10_03705 [Cryobacterium luteum]TFC28817.1 hypothetical protein E3O25_06370 [Cryobacterium sp. TMT1-3]SEN31952.1 hypothetical protein SAMN05216281_10659 [Cryobacterium luteum]